ncbi:hypothetical protein [Mobiluncus mulieris]|uniref:Uncharacterized protein n=2 Tax=Mobiluncus mulieris TaxID=2052 RepID=E0QRA2_9ACTO|nr:hypothetical protein [Mobiluncus mulieris]EFM46095.1 hypothetical protein HMPREF0580_1417 [Mobiluncus mulieris ATCC 35239]MCU9969449.1 hypothetical protein [Mobiluncus mulieris]MCU9970131.1 hypothetical protein [Mobiluncus mulieris]MCU9973888.1 hypothetical protein [Mobiluncus mulieris]MCU9974592.1 hypothetical protein [Mobiluncus mulieris]
MSDNPHALRQAEPDYNEGNTRRELHMTSAQKEHLRQHYPKLLGLLHRYEMRLSVEVKDCEALEDKNADPRWMAGHAAGLINAFIILKHIIDEERCPYPRKGAYR